MRELLRKRWLLHVLFWLGYLLMEAYVEFGWISNSLAEHSVMSRFGIALISELYLLPHKIALVYASFFLINRFSSTQYKHLKTALSLVICLFCFLLFHRWLIVTVLQPFLYPSENSESFFISNRLISHFFDLFLILLLAISFQQYRARMKLKMEKIQLSKEKLEVELKFLKSQINPHFLFNTLNNIYALARANSTRTAETVMKLSELLRFMLYETEKETIPIRQEVKLIHDYIELERIRYSERLQLSFNCSIDDEEQSITPLILLPLVENAFKYGVSETRFEAFIALFLQLKDGKLTFNVRNSKEEDEQEMNERIGLKSLRRQLELIYADYNVEIKCGTTEFDITLTIDLKNYARL